ncbi:hypothetical protein TNCT_470311 [Trichonephila clavata]|uniref:Uncharacterized protein n=1 Tax=Trichonephila clavata TaxID=2740835 RepID=A0A8X6K9H7_TRICU|nr:hypothetical protein TNCT_470311 [Trichonephila clavata]
MTSPELIKLKRLSGKTYQKKRKMSVRSSVLVLCVLVGCVSAEYGGFLGPPRSGPKRATCTVTNGDVRGVIQLSQDVSIIESIIAKKVFLQGYLTSILLF